MEVVGTITTIVKDCNMIFVVDTEKDNEKSR